MKSRITMKKTTAAVALVGVLSGPAAYAAYPVFDATNSQILMQILTAIGTMNSTISGLLYNIGTAINQNGSKIASTIQQAAQTQQQYEAAQQQARRSADAQQSYAVLANVCSESASGGASQIASRAATMKGALRPGGGAGFKNSQIGQAVSSPAASPEVDATRTAKLHALFCDRDDFAAYGGSTACPSISTQMPGADKRVDSILYGAGPEGAEPVMTFTAEQTDVARLYEKNSIRRPVGKAIGKGEAETPAGMRHIGLMNMLNSMLSAAGDPQLQRLADSQPSPGTRELLQEALSSPSAKAYFDQTASPEARRTGLMSQREFEAFEAGRRYANTAYQADLQAMSGDNLMRELIRVQSLNSWLLRGVKDTLERGNIISGQTLASTARQEYAPLLQQAAADVGANAARQ
ncbi:conjugal transfer protein TraW [Achromobacter xylosoxidans]|uniref:conjugal transfer protein TraW n=1 Tax=Achromobacter TaxID=222 RepID=UPI0008A17212|nr:conjugal transfer protein TraW [Achromobacter xylosoxidans]OFS61666.1 conjugal transfer protein TraW [Achromobacter xylosoxidans]